MRRAILAICGTAVGTSLLIGAKSVSAPADPTVAAGSEGEAPAPVVTPTVAASGTAIPRPAGSASPGGTAPTAPGTKPASPAPTQTGGGTSPAPAGGRYHDGTYTGTAATYRYGTVKVTITVSGGQITQATATYPAGGQSGVINRKAIPKLNQETLQAQDADVATISGATLTSEAYRTSLRAAVERASA
jgi:uncharacterized protein with FMN-binding domain